MCVKCIPVNNLSSEYLQGLPPVFERAMRDLHSGNIKPEDLHGDLLSAMASELWSGVSIGMDTDLNAHRTDSQYYGIIKQFEENVYVFSGFKTYHQLKEASLLLTDAEGKIKPFTQFLKDVQGINKTYNVTYLRAEYDNALVSAQMASKWLDTPDDAMLKFIATIDDRTTVICHSLNGLTKPKGWSGWKKYYLPLHWGERSNIIQTFDEATGEHEDDLENPPPMFAGNIALDGVIFPDTHPYFAAPKQLKSVITDKAIAQIPAKAKTAINQADIKSLLDRDIRFKVGDAFLTDPKQILELLKLHAKGLNPKQLFDDIDAAFNGSGTVWKSRYFRINPKAQPAESLFNVSLNGIHPDGGRDIYINRLFIKTIDNGLNVYHDYLTLPPQLQGSGISKGVLNAFYSQYKKLKVGKISVHANIDVGGYAWAKYGFTCDRRSDAFEILMSAKSTLTDKQFNTAEKIFNDYYTKSSTTNDFPINKWANLPYGKDILLGSDWNGTINLKNRKQRLIFETYLGIKK